MFITEPAEPSAQILGLGSKLYPSNMPRMLNKDVTRFIQSLSRVHHSSSKQKKGCAGRVPLPTITWNINRQMKVSQDGPFVFFLFVDYAFT